MAADDLLAPTPDEIGAARRLLGTAAGGGGGGGDPAGAAVGLLAVHPGSGGPAKCWPAERFAVLAAAVERDRGLIPVVLFGPADEAVRRDFEAAAASRRLRRWVPVVGRPLREVLALLALARAYVGNDSGITHLAARACPTLALFGPSDPAVWQPLGRDVAVLRAPAGDLGRLAAPAVVRALDRVLDRTLAGRSPS